MSRTTQLKLVNKKIAKENDELRSRVDIYEDNERLKTENAELRAKLFLYEGSVQADQEQYNQALEQEIAKKLSAKELEEVRQAFNQFDTDGSGTIDLGELQALSKELLDPMSEEEAKKAMEELDQDGSGDISFDEFLVWWVSDRDKDSQKGMKMRLLKLRLRSERFSKRVNTIAKRLERKGASASTNTAADVEQPDENVLRFHLGISAGTNEESTSAGSFVYTPQDETEAAAGFEALSAPEGTQAAMAFHIALRDSLSTEEAEGVRDYIQGKWDKNSEEMFQVLDLPFDITFGCTLEDNNKTLKLAIYSPVNPTAMIPGFKSKWIKTLEGRGSSDFTMDDFQNSGKTIAEMLNFAFDFTLEIDRGFIKFLSALSADSSNDDRWAVLWMKFTKNIDYQMHFRDIRELFIGTTGLASFAETEEDKKIVDFFNQTHNDSMGNMAKTVAEVFVPPYTETADEKVISVYKNVVEKMSALTKFTIQTTDLNFTEETENSRWMEVLPPFSEIEPYIEGVIQQRKLQLAALYGDYGMDVVPNVAPATQDYDDFW